ncbi:hypothetical protein MTR67_031741 [Solanum verrucosum]|uniref:Uncharacterized protein n=1 Tax=Solanum verrucosum TaxID=315347 RepID=A0AAF0ZEA7_SOLVR|nr:hypothetical protein MTR67_031741 [Solanum verrucosum]
MLSSTKLEPFTSRGPPHEPWEGSWRKYRTTQSLGIRPRNPPRVVVLMTGDGGIRGPEPTYYNPSEEPRWPSRSVVLHTDRGRARGWTSPGLVVTGQELRPI